MTSSFGVPPSGGFYLTHETREEDEEETRSICLSIFHSPFSILALPRSESRFSSPPARGGVAVPIKVGTDEVVGGRLLRYPPKHAKNAKILSTNNEQRSTINGTRYYKLETRNPFRPFSLFHRFPFSPFLFRLTIKWFALNDIFHESFRLNLCTTCWHGHTSFCLPSCRLKATLREVIITDGCSVLHHCRGEKSGKGMA
jgi:hypothetical protein